MLSKTPPMDYLKQFLNHVGQQVDTKTANLDGIIAIDEQTIPVGGQHVHVWMAQYGEDYQDLTYITIGEKIWKINELIIDQIDVSTFLCRVEDEPTK